MEKIIMSKGLFLKLSIICLIPIFLTFIRGALFGFGEYLPIAIFMLIGCITAITIAYYFFRKTYPVKQD